MTDTKHDHRDNFTLPPKGELDAITLVVQWEFTADTNQYWLTVRSHNPITGQRVKHSSNCFRWKDLDATGDGALVVRWLREARQHLIGHGPKVGGTVQLAMDGFETKES